MIQLYKKEPFYILQQSSDALSEPKEYASLFKLDNQQQYEGEVIKTGKPSGKGIQIIEADNYFQIQEGIFLSGELSGIRKNFEYSKAT